jgi:hypothetical protein
MLTYKWKSPNLSHLLILKVLSFEKSSPFFFLFVLGLQGFVHGALPLSCTPNPKDHFYLV